MELWFKWEHPVQYLGLPYILECPTGSKVCQETGSKPHIKFYPNKGIRVKFNNVRDGFGTYTLKVYNGSSPPRISSVRVQQAESPEDPKKCKQTKQYKCDECSEHEKYGLKDPGLGCIQIVHNIISKQSKFECKGGRYGENCASITAKKASTPIGPTVSIENLVPETNSVLSMTTAQPRSEVYANIPLLTAIIVVCLLMVTLFFLVFCLIRKRTGNRNRLNSIHSSKLQNSDNSSISNNRDEDTVFLD